MQCSINEIIQLKFSLVDEVEERKGGLQDEVIELSHSSSNKFRKRN
jgi:hypothetical protein